ncbi:uncharacterized protein LOC135333864 [Halichondria panicea]|uniref:uncharacterized protein LOC135333864 n=1 Tax=Halichondria panicea TaxID=6063 RepID=UPI00312B3E7B
MKDKSVKKYILKLVGQEIFKEVKCMASDKVNSILQSTNANDLKCFSWNSLLTELTQFAPLMSSVLVSATKTRAPRSNTKAVIGMCAAIILKHRNPRMNIVQKINSLILYAGHSSKQVYQRLNPLNLTVSHVSMIRVLAKVGLGYDARVKEWRDSLLATITDEDELTTQQAPWSKSTEDGAADSDDCSTDSDDSWKQFPPMTSDEEDQPSEDHDSADDTGDEDLNDSGHLGTCSRSTEEESSG